MKCPMLHAAWILGGRERKTGFDDCLKEECAWWDPSLVLCCVRTISWSLAESHVVMQYLRDKLLTEDTK